MRGYKEFIYNQYLIDKHIKKGQPLKHISLWSEFLINPCLQIYSSISKTIRPTKPTVYRSSILYPFSNKGLTFIEVLIVVAIISGIAALAMGRFDSTNNQMKTTLRQLALLSKELHAKSRIKNLTYRMVIQMDDEKGHGFWVESSNNPVLLTDSANTQEVSDDQDNAESPPPPSSFSVDSNILKNSILLPSGLKFSSVEITGVNQKISGGLAFIYYIPQGRVQEVAIHLESEKNKKWTVAIHPLTGKAKILQGDKPLKDIRQNE